VEHAEAFISVLKRDSIILKQQYYIMQNE